MNVERILQYRRGLRVERLHTIPHLMPYSNASHSANAALIAYLLCKANNINPEHVLIYMLMHDISECHVGDIPADVKRRHPTLKNHLTSIEEEWEKYNLPEKPFLKNDKEIIICKIADIAELGFHCLEELQMGNKMVKHVVNNVLQYIGEYEDKWDCIHGIHQIYIHILEEGKKHGI